MTYIPKPPRRGKFPLNLTEREDRAVQCLIKHCSIPEAAAAFGTSERGYAQLLYRARGPAKAKNTMHLVVLYLTEINSV